MILLEKHLLLGKGCSRCHLNKVATDYYLYPEKEYISSACKRCTSLGKLGGREPAYHRAIKTSLGKVCTKCQTDKPLVDYRYGNNACKECQRAYFKINYQANQAYRQTTEFKEYLRQYRQTTKFKQWNREYQRKLRITNREKIRAYRQTFAFKEHRRVTLREHMKNPVSREKSNTLMRTWKTGYMKDPVNREKRNANMRAWKKENSLCISDSYIKMLLQISGAVPEKITSLKRVLVQRHRKLKIAKQILGI